MNINVVLVERFFIVAISPSQNADEINKLYIYIQHLQSIKIIYRTLTSPDETIIEGEIAVFKCFNDNCKKKNSVNA